MYCFFLQIYLIIVIAIKENINYIQGHFITLAVSKQRISCFETASAVLQPYLIFQSCEMARPFYNQCLSK